MRTGTVLRLALVAVLATATTGLKCAEGPLDRAYGPVGPTPTTRSMAGTWQGTIVSLVMRVSLADNNGTITGTGTMTQNGTPFALTVTGSRNLSSFTLNVAEVDHEPFTFTGTVLGSGTGTTLTGVANGAGFIDQSITLTKQ
jgi:hypothetical protein